MQTNVLLPEKIVGREIYKDNTMELSFLYAIPRTPILDTFFLLITKIAVLISYVCVFVFGQFILKNLFNRPRPCHIDQAFEVLVNRPTSSSFPSTHSAWAFAGATAIFMKFRKPGIAVFVISSLIAFSRMYLFLHFPTDVLCGIIFGIVLGIAADKLCDFIAKKKETDSSSDATN